MTLGKLRTAVAKEVRNNKKYQSGDYHPEELAREITDDAFYDLDVLFDEKVTADLTALAERYLSKEWLRLSKKTAGKNKMKYKRLVIERMFIEMIYDTIGDR